MEDYKPEKHDVDTLSRKTTTAEGHLERMFSKLTMTGMAVAILNTWIALASTLAIVLPSGGPAAFFYGFVFCVACNFAIAASVGEMASVLTYSWRTVPLYIFVVHCGSFLVGWINIAGWLTLVTTEAVFGAGSNFTMVLAQWHTYMYFLAISFFAIGLNIFGYRFLGRWNEGALFWSITAWLAISAVILATALKTDAEFVFTRFTNETG
ncbi:hypothetical protein MBLNU13_g11338t1 [Cladosporium sp. NU13]